jgi:hypothetical protein
MLTLLVICQSVSIAAFAAGPGKGTIRILEAYYGKSGNTRGNVTAQVKDLCQERESCEVPVSNSLWSDDPMKTNDWELTVKYTCGNGKKQDKLVATLNSIMRISCSSSPSRGSTSTSTSNYATFPSPSSGSGVSPAKEIRGHVPAGDGTLDIDTIPLGAAFYVFSGRTYIFSGVVPFRTNAIRNGDYNVCFEKNGYDLFWRSIGIGGLTAPVKVSLREIHTPGTVTSCLKANDDVKIEEREDARRQAQKKHDAAKVLCSIEIDGYTNKGELTDTYKNEPVYWVICRSTRNGNEISREKIVQ